MASVTVPGPNGSSITQTFGNDFNLALAQSIANALRSASDSGNLFQATTDGSAAVPAVPGGKIGELIVEPGAAGRSISVPASYSYVVDTSFGDTIFGSPNQSIMGGGGDHAIIDPAAIVLGDTSSGSTNNITITGAGDNVAVGNGINTLTGTGSGTMSGGTGTNKFNALGNYLINSQGLGGDTVQAGDGATTVNLTGASASVVGGGGALFAVDAGTFDTIFGGGGETHATLTGSDGVVSGNGAVMSVFDGGTGDTINAGQAAMSVTAPGGSFVNGRSGPLNFVGGDGPSTIFGGSGNSTVFGGSGATSLFGGAGGAMEYVNTTSGSLFYEGGTGSETIDASLSKADNNLFLAGRDTAGTFSIVGGAGNDVLIAGTGAGTLAGGGGANFFDFYSSLGGPAVNDVISDFSAIDNVILVGYAPGQAAAAIAGATTAGGSTTITLSDNTKITFTGVTNAGALTDHIQQA